MKNVAINLIDAIYSIDGLDVAGYRNVYFIKTLRIIADIFTDRLERS